MLTKENLQALYASCAASYGTVGEFVELGGNRALIERGTVYTTATFMGTQDPAQWLEDGDFARIDVPEWGCKVHAGFFASMFGQKPDCFAEKVAQKISRHTLLILRGHSLGAAQAQLFRRYIRNRGFCLAFVETLGEPEMGNDAFYAMLRQDGVPHTRVVNKLDIVPHVPGWLFGYSFPSPETWYLVDGKFTQESPFSAAYLFARALKFRLFRSGIENHMLIGDSGYGKAIDDLVSVGA